MSITSNPGSFRYWSEQVDPRARQGGHGYSHPPARITGTTKGLGSEDKGFQKVGRCCEVIGDQRSPERCDLPFAYRQGKADGDNS